MDKKESNIIGKYDDLPIDIQHHGAMERFTYDSYEKKRIPLFHVLKMKKGELIKRDNLSFSILAFVLEGSIRVSTGVYLRASLHGVQTLHHTYHATRAIRPRRPNLFV